MGKAKTYRRTGSPNLVRADTHAQNTIMLCLERGVSAQKRLGYQPF